MGMNSIAPESKRQYATMMFRTRDGKLGDVRAIVLAGGARITVDSVIAHMIWTCKHHTTKHVS